MKALRYYGAHDIRYESMDDPTPQSDRDAIVKVTACAICGSDLHIYHGHGFSEDVGFCVGHEAVGEVVETGRGVSRLKVGDKLMIPAAVGCGSCRQCLAEVFGCELFGDGRLRKQFLPGVVQRGLLDLQQHGLQIGGRELVSA